MTIAKITAGDGYTYLTRHTAKGDTDPAEKAEEHDAAAYYTAEGNPPGRWTGRGAPLLGLENHEVTEDQMRALFGHGQHPNADVIIAAHITANTRPGMTDKQLTGLRDDAIKQARLGRPFPAYQPLDRFDSRVNQRLAIIREEAGRDPTQAEIKKIKTEEARRQRAAVAGFDLVFSPVKSAALLWALDERPWVWAAIRQAHDDAKRAALDLLEDHAAYTRTGTGGIAQIETNGLIAAEFEHWDSRAGDPNLHTHVAVSAKVQGTDGKWRSLDARALYRMTVAASECYNTAFEAALTARLGVTFTARPDTMGSREPVREITTVPFGMIEFFSRRRAAIEGRYAQLVRDYRREHGHDPPASVCHQLARQANLDTRQGKKPPRSLADKRAAWLEELTGAFGSGAVAQLMAAVPGAPAHPAAREHPSAVDLEHLAERAVASVAARRSTWTVWNVRAEVERLLRAEGLSLPAEHHRELADTITALAVSPACSVSVEAPAMLDESAELRRADGESVFTEHTAGRYTSQAVLDAEQRLLNATRTPTAGGLAGAAVGAALDGFEAVTGTRLDPGQRQLVTAFACDTRLLLAGIGPAGSGKTTAMRALAHVLRQGGQRLVPLATSAAAADVLGRELGIRAENLHKFLHEWTSGAFATRLRSGGPLPETARMFRLGPGDVVVVDEAGMAGTFLLDQLVQFASARGAVVRLLGDDRQLPAVESGGALRLVAAQPGTPNLSMLYRFRDPAEAAATLQLRAGDAAAVDWYVRNGRVRSGSREKMTQAAYDGWKADMLAGKVSLMAAADGADVSELAAQARADRVAVGQVEANGARLRDGNLAGAGDWIVTRLNDRRLGVFGGRDWVKNGDAWRVERRCADGSLRVRHLGHGGRVRLPAEYVRDQVQLLYATTAHRAQGTTVDTAHPLITPGMTRESLYVLATRGRERTTFCVATHELPFDEDARVDRVRYDPRQYAAREVLLNILGTEGAGLSATETITVELEDARSLATLVPRYLHAAHLEAEGRYREAAVAVFGEDGGRDLAADPAWGAVVRRLYDAAGDGWEPSRLLRVVAAMRELGSAESVAEVLSWRLDGYLADTPTPPRQGQVGETGGAARERLSDIAVTVLGQQLGNRARTETAWPALIAALRRAEDEGQDAAPLLSSVANARELRTARSVSEVLAWRIGQHLAAQPTSGSAEAASSAAANGPLPWVASPPVAIADDQAPLARYLREASDLIAARVSELADTAVRHRPPWMNLLGHAPHDPVQAGKWLHHVAVIAAYRDQFKIASEDPRQVLGPYPEPGRAGHTGYCHAAESVLTARRLGGVEPLGYQRREVDRVQAQLAADIYRALPDAERAAVATDMATELGALWLGDAVCPDESAATWPAYAAQLTVALSQRGHLTVPSEPVRVLPEGDLRPLEAELAERRRSLTRRASDRPLAAAYTGPQPKTSIRYAPTADETRPHRPG